jgi:hypothetical protein
VQRFSGVVAVVLLLAASASTTHVIAQTDQVEPILCSEQARQGLREVGAWAEAQCSANDGLSFAVLSAQRCGSEAIQALTRVGAWAEAQCSTEDKLSGAPTP